MSLQNDQIAIRECQLCERVSRKLVALVTDLASVKNASSTPSFAFALVSKNLNPNSSARRRPSSSDTARCSSISHLFPIRILLTPSEACCSMFECHVRMSERQA